MCPEGLFDDGRGGCVEEEDCPCIHNSDWYNHGQSITVDCNTWYAGFLYSFLEHITYCKLIVMQWLWWLASMKSLFSGIFFSV